MSETIPGLCILVVEDDPSNRMLLRSLLEKEGYRVLEAGDGQEAVDRFAAEVPDLVLMDLLMPRLDGYEATRRIKEGAGEGFVPVILLTAVTDEEALAHGVDCGADDFLSKPYNRIIIRAKLEAFSRILYLNRMVASQKELLQQHHQRLQHEYEVAQQVLNASAPAPSLAEFPNLRWHSIPKEVSSGDILLAAHTPDDRQCLLVGDLTGHGLSAAVGALPVSDVFYRQTGQGASLEEVAQEVDHRLRAHLPVGFFLACAFLELDPQSGRTEIINAGLPDLLVRRKSGQVDSLPSRFLPLGPMGGTSQELRAEDLVLEEGDRLFAFSDGLTEAIGPDGERFGQERLVEVLERPEQPEDLFDGVLERLEGFQQGVPQQDDLTIAEIRRPPMLTAAIVEEQPSGAALARRAWRLELCLGPEALRQFDPIADLVSGVSRIPRLESHRPFLFTLLSELYNNALEHGVLGLDSSLKEDAEGFSQYYRARQEALADLTEGWIRLELEDRRGPGDGKLYVTVEDSGEGFDYLRPVASLEGNVSLGGRGIPLVRSVCEEVVFLGRGNRVEAVYPY